MECKADFQRHHHSPLIRPLGDKYVHIKKNLIVFSSLQTLFLTAVEEIKAIVMDQLTALSLAQLVLQGSQISQLLSLCSIRCYFFILIIIVEKIATI